MVDYVLELIKVTNETVSREDLFKDEDMPEPKPKKAKKTKAAAKAEE